MNERFQLLGAKDVAADVVDGCTILFAIAQIAPTHRQLSGLFDDDVTYIVQNHVFDEALVGGSAARTDIHRDPIQCVVGLDE